MYQWCKSLVWMVLVKREIGLGFVFYFLTVTGIEHIKVNIVGPDLSKVSETWSKNVDNLICTFF